MYIGLHVKYRLLLLILIKLEFSRQVFDEYSNTKFHENPSNGSQVVSCGQTDRHDEGNTRFSQILRTRLKIQNTYLMTQFWCDTACVRLAFIDGSRLKQFENLWKFVKIRYGMLQLSFNVITKSIGGKGTFAPLLPKLRLCAEVQLYHFFNLGDRRGCVVNATFRPVK